jgi:rod shape determining protein RodA
MMVYVPHSRRHTRRVYYWKMYGSSRSWYSNIDYTVLLAWLVLVISGLIAIYSISKGPSSVFLLESVQRNFERQLMWGVISVTALLVVMLVSVRFLESLSYPLYVLCLGLLVAALLFGREISGSVRWLHVGPVAIQTGTVAALGTLMALSKFISSRPLDGGHAKTILGMFIIITIPAAIMVLQNDTGTSFPLLATIPLMLLWIGVKPSTILLLLSPAITAYLVIVSIPMAIIFAICMTLGMYIVTNRLLMGAVTALATGGVGYLVFHSLTDFLRPHQVARIVSFADPEAYRLSAGFHVIQSKLAIASGGATGRGFMQGTQTQGAYVPEQWTDFIFSTIAEEWGFLGAMVVIGAFAFLISRIVVIGVKSKHRYAAVFSAGVAAVFLTHVIINVGMTLGLMPIIGLPLPLVSYGGSACLSTR